MLTERLSFGFITVVVKYLHCKNEMSYDLTVILLVKFHPCLIRCLVKKQVKQFYHRPGVAQRVQGS
jgi:hypothetical protein